MKAVLYIVILEYSLYSKLSCCIRFIQTRYAKGRSSDSKRINGVLSSLRTPGGERYPHAKFYNIVLRTDFGV